MGGRGNLRHLLEAVYQALRALGIANPETVVAVVVSIRSASTRHLLESHGLEVDFAVLFDRATILEGGERGLKLWLEMFGRFAVEAVAPGAAQGILPLGRQVCRAGAVSQWGVDHRLQAAAAGRRETVKSSPAHPDR